MQTKPETLSCRRKEDGNISKNRESIPKTFTNLPREIEHQIHDDNHESGNGHINDDKK